MITLEDAETVANLLERIMESSMTYGDVEQLQVLLNAFEVYKERNARYRDLWKEYGAKDTGNQLKSKGLRVNAITARLSTSDPSDWEDWEDGGDAFDAINYAAFTIRNVRDGRLG